LYVEQKTDDKDKLTCCFTRVAVSVLLLKLRLVAMTTLSRCSDRWILINGGW